MSDASALSLDVLAIHVMRALTSSGAEGGRWDAEQLAVEVGARRADVRRALSALHAQGFVDVLRMRPTMLGFTLARALEGATLRPVRSRAKLSVAA
jgi:hypothetical protein